MCVHNYDSVDVIHSGECPACYADLEAKLAAAEKMLDDEKTEHITEHWALAKQLAAAEERAEKWKTRAMDNTKARLKADPVLALTAIAKATEGPLDCGHPLDCWDEPEGSQECAACARDALRAQVETLTRERDEYRRGQGPCPTCHDTAEIQAEVARLRESMGAVCLHAHGDACPCRSRWECGESIVRIVNTALADTPDPSVARAKSAAEPPRRRRMTMAKPDNQCPIESGIACLAQWDLIRATDGTEAELVRKVLQAAFREGWREAIEASAKVATPYHTINGNDENGCPRMCEGCRTRRKIRDEIRALPIDGEA